MPRVIPLLRERVAAWLPVLLGCCYLVGGVVVGRVRFAYELDPDEGYNLVKVQLVDRGFALYREVWSDQPPGFTYLGVVFARLLGEEVENVRLVSTLLASALVFAFADLLRRSQRGVAGLASALAVALLLPVTANFSRYSLAAMIGLPAIAWAVLSLWALVVSESKRLGWLIASGFLFAASLWTKLLCAFLLPLFVVLALQQARSLEQRGRVIARGALAWGGACALGLLLGLGPAFAAGGFEQLYTTHVAGGFSSRSSVRVLLRYLAEDRSIYAAALVGFGLSILRRDALGLLLGGWALLALGIVATHDPLWHHHVLLIGVPASVLAALLFGRVAEFVVERPLRFQRLLGLCLLAAVLLVIAYPLLEDGPSLATLNDRSARQLEVDAAIRKRAPQARTVVTSKQIRAFRLGLVVPPELAVTSAKRYRTGQLSARSVARIVTERRPDVVILDNRWPPPVRRALLAAVADGYRLVYENRRAGDVEVYVASSSRRK